MSDTITITQKEYLQLRIASETLNRLEAGGVNNWEYYGEALNPDGEEDFDDMEDRLTKEILG